MRTPLAVLLGAVLLPLTAARAADALPFLSPIFGDHMVLQRGRPNSFWGWAPPGTRVKVTVAGESREAGADGTGHWRLALEAPPAGGPYEVRIEGVQTVVLHDVLCGDIWLCGGQSNMVLPLSATAGGKEEAKTADLPRLRLYTVADRSGYAPVDVPKGKWAVASPATVAGFSAVGYYFGRKLQARAQVPIGLIQSCVGGSPIESWMDAGALTLLGEDLPQLAQIRKLRQENAPETGSFLMNWLAEYDRGDKGSRWAQPSFDDSGWKVGELPGPLGGWGVPGAPAVYWLRREVQLPDPLPPGPAKILLGTVYKMDTTFVNGRWIGASSWSENPRDYTVPAGVLRPGGNLIAIRVFQMTAGGGFTSPAADLRIELSDGTSVPLAGPWRGQLSVDARPPHPLPMDFENYPTMPSVLYNGMIAPLTPLALTGAIWYQGEANQSRPETYAKLLAGLIEDWRSNFGRPDMPFYVVSLPAFQARRPQPAPNGWTDGWARVREAQDNIAREVPHTAVAVTIDTGDPNNIHPTAKRPVGERLAADALALHYGLNVPYLGPEFASSQEGSGVLRLKFIHADGGLAVHGQVLGEFLVAGADRKWHAAQAKLEGSDTVVVSSPEVPAPVAARYAWQADPMATLFNGAGLPAEPFRTDRWPEPDKAGP